MRIRIITTFTDLQATDPEKAEVPALTELTVTAERGAQLVDAGVAEEIEGRAASKPRTRKQASVSPSEPSGEAASAAADRDTSSDADQAPTT